MSLHPLLDSQAFGPTEVVQVEQVHDLEVLETYLAIECEKLEQAHQFQQSLSRIEQLFGVVVDRLETLEGRQALLTEILAGPVPEKK